MNRISAKFLELLQAITDQAEESLASFIKFLRIRYLGEDKDKQKRNVYAKGVIPTALVNRAQQPGVGINQPLGGKVMNPINQVNASAANVDPRQHTRNVKKERKRSVRRSSSTSLR